MTDPIVVGMSGGVDSSVAAALLLEAGHDVIGVTLHLWDYAQEGHAGRCCAPEDQYDAVRVCATLGIPHYTFDRRALFREKVVDPFVAEYASGRTPSPCVRCNESVKLGPLAAIGRRLGAKRIATGHYARLSATDRDVVLRTAVDRGKDQSYFLWAAPTDVLRAMTLPLGELTKETVREHAVRRGLCNASKPDSTDLCFVEGGDYAGFVSARSPASETDGVIETLDGTTVGTHAGVHHFTVGQRKGIGAGGVPRYVLKIVPERNAVIVGTSEEAMATTVRVEALRWLVSELPERVDVRVRYRHAGTAARVERVGEGTVMLHLDTPHRGVAPGQAAVMYVGEQVVGGGWIA